MTSWRSVWLVARRSSCLACQLAIWPLNILPTVACSVRGEFRTRYYHCFVLFPFTLLHCLSLFRLPSYSPSILFWLAPTQDLERVCKATGSRVQTSVNGITDDVLGTCEDFEERQVGDERYNIFTGCPQRHTSTIVLRGGAEQFLEESHRSIWGM